MIGPNIPIENMSHLTSAFPLRAEPEDIHATQQTKKKIKLTLLFVVPGEMSGESINFEDQRPESLPRIVSIRVPRGVPVAKIRMFIRFIEDQLHEIYGKSKRLNFVMVGDEDSNNWVYEFELPTFGVVYV